jgi:protein-L-isoaspartate(D-aspartate) O-methyltransferase
MDDAMFTRVSETDLAGIGMTSQRTRDRLVERLRDKGIRDERVLEVMRQTPRHLFVDEALASRAYEDVSLPIGHAQTISQPFVVARMTEALLAGMPDGGGRVLELGTGSGYQAAVLAALVEQVFTIERIGALARRAHERFRRIGLRNIRLRHGDGHTGWPGQGPFDAVIVTAAPEYVPRALFDQIASSGCLLAPVGGDSDQRLVRYARDAAGVVRGQCLDEVSFVPFLGGRT